MATRKHPYDHTNGHPATRSEVGKMDVEITDHENRLREVERFVAEEGVRRGFNQWLVRALPTLIPSYLAVALSFVIIFWKLG